MDSCRLSLVVSGVFNHPLGDQTPIDLRYGEDIATVELPERKLLVITEPTVLTTHLVNPRAVIVENLAGLGLQTLPTDEEAAAIAAKVLLLGVSEPDRSDASGGQPLLLHPAKAGQSKAQGQFLWLAPGAVVSVRPALGVPIPIRAIWFPAGAWHPVVGTLQSRSAVANANVQQALNSSSILGLS